PGDPAAHAGPGYQPGRREDDHGARDAAGGASAARRGAGVGAPAGSPRPSRRARSVLGGDGDRAASYDLGVPLAQWGHVSMIVLAGARVRLRPLRSEEFDMLRSVRERPEPTVPPMRF